MTDEEFDAELKTLFLEEADLFFGDITRSLSALEADRGNQPALDELMRRFHSFAGMGGLDGIETITQLSSRTENECRQLLTEGAPPAPEQLPRWWSTLASMKSVVDEMKHACAA